MSVHTTAPIRRPSFPKRWLAGAWPLAPALALLLATSDFGYRITPDSIQYLAAAESIRSTGGLGAGFLHWPPLYPALLSLHQWFGLEATTFAAVVGRIAAFATILGAWAIGRRVVSSPLVLAFGLLALACLPHFDMVHAHVWSEALYVALCVWLAYSWSSYLAGGSRWWLPASAVLLACAMLTRHVGVVWPIAMLLTAAIAARNRGNRQLGVAAALIVLACMPYALWVLRTLRLSGTYGGPRAPLQDPDLLQQGELFGRTIGHWIFPHLYPLAGGVAITLTVLLGFLAFLAWLLRHAPTRERTAIAGEFRHWFLLLAVLFMLGHSVLTIYTASRYTLDVNPRTVFPILWAFGLVCICLAESAHRRAAAIDTRLGTALQVTAVIYGLLWFSAPNTIVNSLI